MLKLGVLSSGFLGFDTLKKIVVNYQVNFVFTDSNSKDIIDFCKGKSIPLFKGNPRNEYATKFINQFEVDIICSVNYLFLIDSNIISKPKGLIFNLHGSLLPKYRGRTPHVWAIINNESQTGITAHKIEKGCDTGDIIEQVIVPISKENTGAEILNKYSELYYPLIDKVLKGYQSNSLIYIKQNEENASYFGKRTPKDGNINWNWDGLRIYNWIRAQANPYPGAFTFYNNKKIIIDKVSFSEEKINNNQLNGEIIKLKPNLVVKTKNGAIKLDVIRTENCTFTKGNIFGNENRK